MPDNRKERVPRGAVALRLLEDWHRAGERGLLFLSKSERDAEYLGANIYSLVPDCPVMVFPRWDSLPYDPAGPSREIMGRRASVLRRLAGPLAAPLVIATSEAALQRVPPPGVWAEATMTLRVGHSLSIDALRSFLVRTGYVLDALVDEPGEAVLHGQVLDLFPAGALAPVRVELDGDRITAIRSYDPLTQRTATDLSEVVLDAASEVIGQEPNEQQAVAAPDGGLWLSEHYPRLDALFDYMPQAALVTEPGIEEHGDIWLDQVREGYEGAALIAGRPARTRPIPAPERLFLGGAEWRSRLRRHRARPLETTNVDRVPRFAAVANSSRAYRAFISSQLDADRRVVLTAGNPRDLKTMIRRAAPVAAVYQATDWQAVVERSAPAVIALSVDFEAGFALAEPAVTVIAAADLLGSRARHQVPMATSRQSEGVGGEPTLQIGGRVVHLEHGVGLLRGIETVAVAEMPEQDVLRLEYAGGTTLMVPVQEIGSVYSYGAVSSAVPLDRLGGEAWPKRRAEIEAAIAETAKEIADIVREHDAQPAPKLSPPARQYERFAAGFPFLLTPDQAQAVEDVLADLASGRRMDRLVCGDVGFGKTEIALRAAAVAVLSGKQAAVVVPTTVLARQHLGIFKRRLAAFGLRVELLSRLLTAPEARVIKKGLRDGEIDVVIGTQAIAAADVRFKELALLIIDEEQRFGARLKEKLRQFGEGLHVLTMSATPIPRTLQRALVGLQSLSMLETPPARRLPIRTVLRPFAPDMVRDALFYERRRGGQSFFVCPRIEDLEPTAARLCEIVPGFQMTVVHGKLPPAEADEAMVAFAEGQGDILLATNIIESGLDIPRANTILIWRPDRFGAAQLHQLRGRVGRGRRRGMAYLLTDPDTTLPAATERRLRSVTELDRLGAGLAISRRDLDLRGAGELLGEAQTGHIRMIGIELYQELLDRVRRALTGGDASSTLMTEIGIDVAARLPADYIAEPEPRINIYARLARLRDWESLEQLADEIEDRFGAPPSPVRALIDLARIRETARALGIVKVDAGPVAIAFTFEPRHAKSLRRRLGPCKGSWNGDRLVIPQPSTTAERANLVLAALERLEDPPAESACMIETGDP
jgi:transcription-repair coupling factor (superfamily II helicase)